MTHEKLQQFKTNNSRPIEMPDGTVRIVRMTPALWEDVEFLWVMEEITTTCMAQFALEEQELHGVTFDRAFRGVVAHLSNRWTA